MVKHNKPKKKNLHKIGIFRCQYQGLNKMKKYLTIDRTSTMDMDAFIISMTTLVTGRIIKAQRKKMKKNININNRTKKKRILHQ